MHVLWSMQRIVRTEWDDFAIGQDVMDAALFGRPYIKVPGIHERNDDDSEHVLVQYAAMFFLRQCLRRNWQATTEVSQRIDGGERH